MLEAGGTFYELVHRHMAAIARPNRPAPGGSLKVLVADDRPMNRIIIMPVELPSLLAYIMVHVAADILFTVSHTCSIQDRAQERAPRVGALHGGGHRGGCRQNLQEGGV